MSMSFSDICKHHSYYVKNDVVQTILKEHQNNPNSYLSLLPIDIIKSILSNVYIELSRIKKIEHNWELDKYLRYAKTRFFAIKVRCCTKIFKYVDRILSTYRFSRIINNKIRKRHHTHELKFLIGNKQKKIGLTRVNTKNDKYISSVYNDSFKIARLFIDEDKINKID